MVEVEVTDHLGGALACVDRARYGLGEAASLADAIRVGLVGLAAAVRDVAGRTSGLDEERWVVLTERVDRLRGEADMRHHRHAALGEEADGLGHAHAALQLDRAAGGGIIEIRVIGTGKDGTPACATIWLRCGRPP